ncbi:NADPH2:quinone reductase [Desulfuromusa kysingii]|uniref:NADPH2:quinone reductase n=1 Tax=Desulfuromusa kysingii TaxID=37625 RepID=A0A1H4BJP5_9BACT|nr:NADPH:quinone reductase [Desulfuromusa kysingii]SEA48317.1 NADPH2:quinone reductase [Desulfuromusa kysingii]
MQAIQVHKFGAPEVMQLEEVPDLVPAENQLLIEVKAVGVNPVDTYIRAGVYPLKPELPYTPGKDAAGIVTAVGSAVVHRKVGDRIYVCGCPTGSYAQQLLCDEDQAFTLPDNITFTSGAALGVPYSTASFALNFRAHALPGETLLIHGASGSVGIAAIQIAKANGLRVIGTAGTQAGLDLIKSQGVIAALNHKSDNYLDALNDLTCNQGVDVILEMLANVNLDKDLKLLAKFGRIVVIGNRGRIEIDPRDTMGKNASIHGMSLFNADTKVMHQIHASIKPGLIDGRYKPIIHSELPLAEAAKAHDLVMQEGVYGKVVLIP